jgi:hypothetical protein
LSLDYCAGDQSSLESGVKGKSANLPRCAAIAAAVVMAGTRYTPAGVRTQGRRLVVAEDASSKQASQTVEYLKLFQQIGRTFLGLLLIEIGWTVFLVLATKLTGSESGAPTIGTFSFVAVWVYGAVILAVFWGFYSHLIQYVASPIVVILKIFSDVFFVIIAFILVILDSAVVVHIVRPIRKALIRRQLKLDKAAWITKNVQSQSTSEANERYEAWLKKVKERIGADFRVDKEAWVANFKSQQSRDHKANADPEVAFSEWKTNAQREYADKIWESIAADKVFLNENILEQFVQTIGNGFLTPLHSGLVVGVAPLARYSQRQDLAFDRPALQQFGDAIAAARVRLSQLSGIGYIAIRPLPSLFRIE